MNNDYLTSTENEFDKPKLPSTLNVLTILSLIWTAIQFLGGLFGFFTAKKNYENVDKTISQMNSDEMPGFMKSMMGNPEDYREMVTQSYDNRIPILVLTLVAVALCFYGLIQMRKLKKQGYTFYVIGELLPYITTVLFIGSKMFSSSLALFFMGISILFIILYTVQRKHLVY